MEKPPKTNVSVAANIWTDCERSQDPSVYAASQFVPGDLIVNIIKDRDVRSLPLELTTRQYLEYRICRFFNPHGHSGHAYDDR
jgi:hypothetical protein